MVRETGAGGLPGGWATFVAEVRARPERYFGVDGGSEELPTEVLQRVVHEALHRADGTHRRIAVEIAADLAFTVTDDRRHAPGPPTRLLPGPAAGAAAALSVRTVVEVWADGRGHRREANGPLAPAPWRECPAPRPHGTRLHLALDPDRRAPGAALAWALLPVELHDPTCPTPATFPLHDLRTTHTPAPTNPPDHPTTG
ncbi:hypothetical protein [Streptomyces sp. NPDC097619]|uniref:hypothetical protein n=1 Tax=Streptomyces sp. NPDC097619 TaxID=3157228 RepID=UPI00332F3FBF